MVLFFIRGKKVTEGPSEESVISQLRRDKNDTEDIEELMDRTTSSQDTHTDITKEDIITEEYVTQTDISEEAATKKHAEESKRSETSKKNISVNNSERNNKTEENTILKKQEVTTTKVKHSSGELTETSELLFEGFRHMNTNRLWGSDRYSLGIMHPKQFAYLQSESEKWYKGEYTIDEFVQKMYDCPSADVYDEMECSGEEYGLYWYKEAIWKVRDAEAHILEYDGYRDDLTHEGIFPDLVDDPNNKYRYVTRYFLFIKAYYDSIKDKTYVYYAAGEIKTQKINFDSITRGSNE